MNEPKISIIAPVYGVEKYIEQFLDSIRKQTFQDFEVVLVDDGSKDRCPQILDDFEKEDERYKVIHQENGGVSKARNTGLAHAKGEYVYIVDSDDWLTDNALEVLWKAVEITHADIIYGDYFSEIGGVSYLRKPFDQEFCSSRKETICSIQRAVNNNGISTKANCPEFKKMNTSGGAPWRAMVRRGIIEDNQLWYDPSVRGLGDDILFTLHLYDHIQSVAYTSHPIYHYRIVPLSYSHGFKANLLENYRIIFDRMEEFLTSTKKDSEYWDAYYFRVLIYFSEAIKRYFKNKENPKLESERFNEMKALLKTEPYRSAVEKVDISRLLSKKMKIKILLLKMKMFRLLWKLCN